MAAKKCKYCNIQMLEGFDEIERKFYEQGTRTLHTRERCEALRNSSAGAGRQTTTAGSAGIEQWAAIGVMLDSMKKQLDEMESKIDQALLALKGQSTFNGNE